MNSRALIVPSLSVSSSLNMALVSPAKRSKCLAPCENSAWLSFPFREWSIASNAASRFGNLWIKSAAKDRNNSVLAERAFPSPAATWCAGGAACAASARSAMLARARSEEDCALGTVPACGWPSGDADECVARSSAVRRSVNSRCVSLTSARGALSSSNVIKPSPFLSISWNIFFNLLLKRQRGSHRPRSAAYFSPGSVEKTS
mmetsp:Transcript_5730/g.17762  ORF Transcript_5730/g.17762 Transcript_5730/m.17762 type:complete len:203 (+) Transcript_5730:885-1493(+)